MSTLHITNGDSAAGTLRTIVDGDVISIADVLHEGPAPAVPLDAWYQIRGEFLARGDAAASAKIAAAFRTADDRVMSADDPVVLWFEHDLFDQLLLIRVLDLIDHGESARLKPRAPSMPLNSREISMICIDRFPGVDRFIGLGQLTAAELRTLVGTEQPVAPSQFERATRAWAAFRAPDPTALMTLARDGSDELPFLGPALRRFLQEYPSTEHGLSRTATAVLRALVDGPLEAGALFITTQQSEEAPFMGDWGLFDVVHGLATARVPLLTITPPRRGVDLRGHTIAISGAGREVLEGVHDAIALNGIDLWRGGVHLEGDHSAWRWDEAAGTLVS